MLRAHTLTVGTARRHRGAIRIVEPSHPWRAAMLALCTMLLVGLVIGGAIGGALVKVLQQSPLEGVTDRPSSSVSDHSRSR